MSDYTKNSDIRDRLIFIGVLVWFVWASSGCVTKENRLSLEMADRSIETAQAEVRGPELRKAVEAVAAPDVRAAIEASLAIIDSLLGASRVAIRPPLTLLAQGEPLTEPLPPVAEIRAHSQEWCAKVQQQAGRAGVEAEGVLSVVRWGSAALEFGKQLGGDLLAQALLLVGGGGTVAALAVKGVALWRQTTSLRAALGDAVRFGNDMARADTDTQATRVIEVHKQIQADNGTRGLIQAAGATATAASTQPEA